MTIRDTINRQRESRESAERARLALLAAAEAEARAVAEAKIAAEAQAEAEAEARAVAEEQARLQAIADAEALRQAEEQAKIQARLDAKVALKAAEKAKAEAKALAKAEAKAQKQAAKEARLQAKFQAKAVAKEEAKARSLARAQAKAKAKAQKQADKQARLQAKREAKAAAEEDYRIRSQAKRQAKEAAKAEALKASQAKRQAKAEAKAAAEAESQARALLRAEEIALEFKKAEEQAQKQEEAKRQAKEEAQKQAEAKRQAQAQAKAISEAQAKAELAAMLQARAEADVDAESRSQAQEQDKSRLQAKAKAEALQKSKLERIAKAKHEARALELAKVKAEAKAEAARAARELAQARAIAKAEAKEQARVKAIERAQARALLIANLKLALTRKVEKAMGVALNAMAKLRHNMRHLYQLIAAVNYRRFARVAYGTVILGVVALMVQVFMERYPQTSGPDIVFEMPIEPEFAVIEAPDHVEASASEQLPTEEDNVIGTVTSSVAVVAPPKIEPVAMPEPEPEPEPTVEPVLTLANWQINAVESNIPAGFPRLVIVIDDLGMSVAVSQKLAKLPAPLTLAFLPYANRLEYQSSLVAKKGHELLVHMPMAPKGHRVDPGNNALLDNLSKKEFEKRLNWNLSRFTGFIGINNHMGSSLTEHTKEMGWVMAELKDRGLVFLDSVTTNHSVAASEAQLAGVPTLSRNVFLDNERDPDAILGQLKLAMLMAQRRGLSIAIGHPYPETLAVLKKWLPKLEQEGIILTPLSAAISEKYIPATRLAASDMPALVRSK